MAYKFNGGNGAITCDNCSTIIKTNISPKEYNNISTGVDLCDKCKLIEVDNFELISNFIEFNNKNEFYFLQVIQRQKDGNVTPSRDNRYRTIKSYYIFSKEQLLSKKDKIKELCIKNNARAYISVNRRNAQEVALESIQQYAKLIYEGNGYQGTHIYDSVCGYSKALHYPALWIVDVDSNDDVFTLSELIDECGGDIIMKVPTVHGTHLITGRFNRLKLIRRCRELSITMPDIQRNNSTLLYYRVP